MTVGAPTIRVAALGKRYRTAGGLYHDSLREAVSNRFSAPFRRRNASPRPKWDEFIWAVRDVSFDMHEGDILGVIGRNGAGKSTLLKLLSRITDPTEGEAELRGRVGSLLEVGAGFHHELTGRENVYLNGAILGMRKSEVERKFDEIVEFSGVSRFIDMPVKRYSSGMIVRLAFAVAAHIEPDILLVDEVLAVGDAEFQKRCLGRMEGLRDSGRTVIFVSHSAPAVLRICPRVILLDGGRVIADGPSQEVMHTYLDTGLGTTAARIWPTASDAPGDDVARVRSVRVLDPSGRVCEENDIRGPIDIEVEYWLFPEAKVVPEVALGFRSEDGTLLFVSVDHQARDRTVRPGVVRSVCRIPGNLLAEGQIFVDLALASRNQSIRHAFELDVVAFHVVDPSEGDAVRGEIAAFWPGVVRPMLEWRTEQVCDEPAPDSAESSP